MIPALFGMSPCESPMLECCRPREGVSMLVRSSLALALCAGVTETAALQKTPRPEAIIAEARRRTPSGRMTTTEDVARAIVVLAHPDTYWITGNVIGVDGGEDIVG